MGEGEFDKQIGAEGDANGADAAADLGGYDAASYEGDAADETTGASPGTAQGCADLGLSSLSENLKRFNIKPPGMA